MAAVTRDGIGKPRPKPTPETPEAELIEVYVPEDALAAQLARNISVSQEQARRILVNFYADDTPGCRELDKDGNIIARPRFLITERISPKRKVQDAKLNP